MKGVIISLAIVMIGLLLLQANQISTLQAKVEALHVTQSQAMSGPNLRGTRNAGGLPKATIDMQIALQNTSDELTKSFSKMLEEQQAYLTEQQLNSLNEYFQSEAFEARLWAITQSFILDFSHPANAKALQEHMSEQKQAYREEELRRNPIRAVTNNLRQISSAADQYFLEKGKDEVRIEDLIGPNKYIGSLKPILGESYEGMVIRMGEPIRVTLQNREVVELDF